MKNGGVAATQVETATRRCSNDKRRRQIGATDRHTGTTDRHNKLKRQPLQIKRLPQLLLVVYRMFTVKEALQEAVKGNTPDIVIGSDFYLANNKQAMDAVTSKWNDWLNGFLRTVAKQLQQIKVADTSCRVVKPPSMITRFFNRVYEDMTSCVWKGLAYFLAVCALSFGAVGWYKYYKLVLIVKEYAIVRYVLEEKPANRKTIDGIDKLLKDNDIDKVYEVWKQERERPK